MDIKCTECGHWNKDLDFCEKCNSPVSAKQVQKTRDQQRKEKTKFRKANSVDLWLGKMSKSENIFVKVFYRVIYSAWFIIMSLISLAIYLVAGTPG
jgi:uncharacterized membrane protein YvbJ